MRLGKKTLDEIEATIERLGIASNAGRTGELDIANFDWRAVELAGVVDDAAAVGQKLDLLSAEAARARVDSR